MGQDRFILTITKDEIVSTDKRFTIVLHLHIVYRETGFF